LNILIGLPTRYHLFKSTVLLKCYPNIILEAVFKKTKYINERCLSRAICANQHCKTGNVAHFDIAQRLEIANTNGFDAH